MNQTLTALNGVRVGHATRLGELTGATVVAFDRDLPVATCCYGGVPSTFHTDVLDASRGGGSFRRVHAMFVAGGGYAGLPSGGVVMQGLIAEGIGFDVHASLQPNVTGAIILDLGTRLGQFDPSLAGEALRNVSPGEVERGNVGAGTGATVGKFNEPNTGLTFAGMKAGVGCGRRDLWGGAFVVALSVVNAVGNVIARDGSVLAGNRSSSTPGTFSSFDMSARSAFVEMQNTTVTIVGTNVKLDSVSSYERVAHLASHGHVRAIDPVNMSVDGDSIFVFSTEEIADFAADADSSRVSATEWPQFAVDVIGRAAATAVQDSIYDACLAAETVPLSAALNGVVPSLHDFPTVTRTIPR